MRARGPRLLLPGLLAAAAGACTPTLNWRDVHLQGSTLAVQFPCRPDRIARRVALAGPAVPLSLYACRAGGLDWAVGLAEMGDAARVEPALQAWRRETIAHVRAQASPGTPLPVPGAMPQPGVVSLRLAGQRPDGRAVQLRLVLFARGGQVYQATVLGEQVSDAAAQPFFASMRFGP
ncbi:MAG: hypothetical protein KGL50_03865 [Burkholderiales bacterium]|nr:hypothetical protein [Burkholderiales bacterium]